MAFLSAGNLDLDQLYAAQTQQQPQQQPSLLGVDDATLRELAGATQGGRYDLFNQFLAASPSAQAITPFARRALEQQFRPLSAQFALGGIGGVGRQNVTQGGELEGGYGTPDRNFSQFLQNVGGAGGLNPGRFMNMIDPIRNILPSTLESRRDYQQRAMGFSGVERGQLEALSDPLVGANIITQAQTGGMHPLLRPYAQQALQRRFDAFRGGPPDPQGVSPLSVPLFAEFARRGYAF